MKKIYKLQDLDCANCAAKMESAIAKLKGVDAVSISFMTQKMTLSAADAEYDRVLKEAVKICKKVEPDCEILV